jgi:SAM-dependent methyltransferase
VVGIDVTPEMVQLACRNATDAGVRTVSFLLGEIERLPVLDEVFDVAISNCVINLCPDKTRVLTEVHRVLRHGGRLAVADIVALAPLPCEVADDLALYAGCVAGAVTVDELSVALHKAGFKSVRIVIRDKSEKLIRAWAPSRGLERCVAAVNVTAIKY